MRWPQFNVYDFFIVFAFCILNFYLYTNWEKFDSTKPINYWLAVDYVLLLVIRIVYVIKNSGYSEKVIKICRIFTYGFIFPLIVTWSILGLFWYQDGLDTIPEDLVPWSYILWLAITVIGGVMMIIDMIYDFVQYRKLRRFIKQVEEADQPYIRDRDSWSRSGGEVDVRLGSIDH